MVSGLRIAGLAATVLVGAIGISGCTQVAEAPPASTPTTAASDRDLNVARLLYSRSPVTLNPHLATGYQDFEAARIVYEPLASYDAEGQLQPFLAATVPTVENGGVAEDGRSVTWQLRQDVTWSDGEPFTADDVVFTYEFVSNPQVAAATAQFYEAVDGVEALDDHTVKVTFKEPNPAWSVPFTGQTGMILPRHVWSDYNNLEAREALANWQPIGTGPYTVLGFEPGLVVFAANPAYWDGTPGLEGLELVGNIAPYAAARDVMVEDQADFAHNLQVEAKSLNDLKAQGKGRIVTVFGSYVERIMLNFADPFAATESGERASAEVPHPYFSDLRVRKAINLAINRSEIATELYGFMGEPAYQLLVTPETYLSEADRDTYDLDKAGALLDEAGWIDTNENGVRDKNGVEMKLRFQAPVNPVRQATQSVVKADLEALGIEVEIDRIRVDDFFSADPKQTKSLNHFYADMQIYSTGNESPDPITYMGWWTCDKISAQENQWQDPNNARYCNSEYDALWQAASQELDLERRTELLKSMDQLLVEDVAVIPVVHRAIANAVSSTLVGLEPTPWDTSTWDIKNWHRQDDSQVDK
ncbi:peptide ABC transporter substrate-binding protein [filamentous cyanobacterium CCP5]|nr:peptide ABC transporter substrate-binding protein [filamentous cyanobacterium CCP5]